MDDRQLLIKPAKKNIHSFLEEIRKVFRKARSITQADLIKILNPKIRGWANYHRSVVSKETFSRIDAVIWHLCFRWAKRRHPDKSKGWVLEQYFKPIKGRSYRNCDNGLSDQDEKLGDCRKHICLLLLIT
jgi:RNA-directed DNA polymerase